MQVCVTRNVYVERAHKFTIADRRSVGNYEAKDEFLRF